MSHLPALQGSCAPVSLGLGLPFVSCRQRLGPRRLAVPFSGAPSSRGAPHLRAKVRPSTWRDIISYSPSRGEYATASTVAPRAGAYTVYLTHARRVRSRGRALPASAPRGRERDPPFTAAARTGTLSTDNPQLLSPQLKSQILNVNNFVPKPSILADFAQPKGECEAGARKGGGAMGGS